EQTKDFILTGLMNNWLDCVTIIIALSIMFFLDIKLTLAAIIIFPFYIFTVYFFFGRLRKLTRKRSQALAEVQGFLHERVQGMSVIKSFAIEDNEAKNFDKKNKNFLSRAFQHTSWNAYSFAAINTVTDLGPIIVIGVGSYLAITGSITVGTLAAFVGYLEQLFGPLRRLVSSFTTLTQSFASMDRIFQLIDEDYDIKNKKGAQPIEIKEGHIELKNVSFKYNEDESLVLKNINLNINKGETVAFVGMSGGGKSTLINLIPRFYDVSEGEILIDSRNIKDYLTGSLRNQIGLVQQDNILFSDTVRENILLGRPDATEEEIIEAAKMANAHDFIMNLPNGYDTEVGERGVKLSGGQKQRLSIARIFLNNPPILILDEATSALDLESEAIIQDALDVLSKDRTTLIVAHRLSTITHADKIIVMQHGQIVETGTHKELIAKKGEYEHLYSIQDL
ncbi:MAG: ABC transporter ATP-binding protein, partial [Staphylococcus hominis]